MSRTFLIVLATVAAMALLLMLGHAVTAGSHFVAPPPAPQPDTASPNWRALTDDVALWLRGDAELGVRAQLYVRLDGQWRAVVLESDGPGVMPAR